MLSKIRYERFKWKLDADLNMMAIALGIQEKKTNYPGFFCNWKRPEKGDIWTNDKGNQRTSWVPDLDKDVVFQPLIPQDCVLLSLFHLKVGLMTQII